MASATLTEFVHHLRYVLRTGPDGERTDPQLLERFVTSQDDVAFATLVQRHGPMVLGVCRRLLDDAGDVEDAFQAVFLVLVHRAASIARPEQLGNWLYGVAYRVALRARSQALRRRRHEQPHGDLTSCEGRHETAAGELRALLDEAIHGLPDKYRGPVVLCYLQGLTLDEAARRLGCTRGSVKGRLERARQLLRRRLVAHGVAPAALVVLAGTADAAAAVPAALMHTTVRAAVRLAGGQALAGVVSVQAVAWMQAAVRVMGWARLGTAAGVLLALALVAAGTGLVACQAQADRPPAQQTQPAGQAAGAKVSKPKTDRERLQGGWQVIRLKYDGEEKSKADFRLRGLLFRGDRLFLETYGELVSEVGYHLDPTTTPKQLHLRRVHRLPYWYGPRAGIYEFRNGQLVLCTSDGDDPPSRFESSKGSRLMLMTLKRLPDREADELLKKDRAADRDRGGDQMKLLGMALRHYHLENGHFPPAAIYDANGKPLLSWRVLILPHLDPALTDLYNEFKLDEPWDSPHNKKLLARMPPAYRAPGKHGGQKDRTFYQVFAGPGSVFDGKDGLRLADITDGDAYTILVVEGAEPVPWTKPVDVPFDPKKPLPKVGGLWSGSFQATFADGSCHHISKRIGERYLRALITRNGGETYLTESRDW